MGPRRLAPALTGASTVAPVVTGASTVVPAVELDAEAGPAMQAIMLAFLDQPPGFGPGRRDPRGL